MSRSLLIVANWKANMTVEEAKAWFSEFTAGLANNSSTSSGQANSYSEIAIAPPFPLIYPLTRLIEQSQDSHPVFLASQDISAFPLGSYTGEVPGSLLKNLSVKYALIGHSERRKYFSETNQTVEAKLKQALDNNITPIICAQTLEEIPENIRNYPTDKLYVMYEPARAISHNGIYHAESPASISEVLTTWQAKLPTGIRFLYGGSVNPNNIKDFSNLLVPSAYSPASPASSRGEPAGGLVPIISGFVIGHASLDPMVFLDIIGECNGFLKY